MLVFVGFLVVPFLARRVDRIVRAYTHLWILAGVENFQILPHNSLVTSRDAFPNGFP